MPSNLCLIGTAKVTGWCGHSYKTHHWSKQSQTRIKQNSWEVRTFRLNWELNYLLQHEGNQVSYLLCSAHKRWSTINYVDNCLLSSVGLIKKLTLPVHLWMMDAGSEKDGIKAWYHIFLINCHCFLWFIHSFIVLCLYFLVCFACQFCQMINRIFLSLKSWYRYRHQVNQSANNKIGPRKKRRHIFTALHVMQTRSSDENSVRPSVRSSVRPSHAWSLTKRKKDLSRFVYHTKEHLS